MMKDWIRRFQYWLDRFTQPYADEIVSHLIRNVAWLELAKGERMEFAPLKGCCSVFYVSGTCLPVFEYNVFEKKIMEFIHIRVEISKPDRINFIATIESDTAPERNGEIVKVEDKYKAPFIQLAQHLFRYFPYYKKVVALSNNAQPIQAQIPILNSPPSCS